MSVTQAQINALDKRLTALEDDKKLSLLNGELTEKETLQLLIDALIEVGESSYLGKAKAVAIKALKEVQQ